MTAKWRKRLFYLTLVAIVLVSWGIYAWQSYSTSGGGKYSVALTLPTFSKTALAGQKLFKKNCSQCHGKNASGSDKGPPLIHDIYNPGHHSDAAIHRAVETGTPQHHWPYGDMPAQKQVSERQVTAIIKFLRELQEANGIFYRKHVM